MNSKIASTDTKIGSTDISSVGSTITGAISNVSSSLVSVSTFTITGSSIYNAQGGISIVKYGRIVQLGINVSTDKKWNANIITPLCQMSSEYRPMWATYIGLVFNDAFTGVLIFNQTTGVVSLCPTAELASGAGIIGTVTYISVQ